MGYGPVPSNWDHWNRHAVLWDLFGPPLRPSPDDLDVVARVVTQLSRESPVRGLRVLVLGVTREYARFPWPRGSTLVAWERSESMIRHVWPGSTAETERVIQRNWLDPTESRGEFDLVLGDGVLVQLSFPDECEELCRTLRAVLRPGGQCILRLFARPETPEEPDQVFADAQEGRLTNINEFKLRLGMALCAANGAHQVAVADIWKVWDQSARRDSRLRNRWSADQKKTIESYRESIVSYSFPPLDLVLDVARRFLKVRDVCFPGYPFARGCPTLVLERESA